MDDPKQIQVVLTDAALAVVQQVQERRGDQLSLVIGNGCCDSTAPFLFADYVGGPNEREIATHTGVRVLVDELIAGSFEGREVVIDAVAAGAQPDSFSCEAELGYRFSLDRLPAMTVGRGSGPAAVQ
jgi:uncharacterized protein (DUF779 family)